MDAGIAAVIAAVIAAAGGVVVVVIQQIASFRTENRNDHAKVLRRLEDIAGKVDLVRNKLTDHLTWHLDTKEIRADGRAPESNKGRRKAKV